MKILTDADILERIKLAREMRGLTQKEVDEKLGKRKMYMFDIERGRMSLRSGLIRDLCKLYFTTPDAILGFLDKSPAVDMIMEKTHKSEYLLEQCEEIINKLSDLLKGSRKELTKLKRHIKKEKYSKK